MLFARGARKGIAAMGQIPLGRAERASVPELPKAFMPT